MNDQLYEAPIGENPQVSPECLSKTKFVLIANRESWIWDAVPVSGRCECTIKMLIRHQDPNIDSEFADLNQSADVIGVDLSPIQPKFVPPNCRFEVDDITQDWTYPTNHFDFIHVRGLIGCLPDWTELFERAFKLVIRLY